LGKIGQIDLLPRLCTKLIIPGGVVHEIEQGATTDPARVWVRERGSPFVQSVNALAPVVAAWDLGLGESHVLHLCYGHPGKEAILDDRAARHCASALGVPVRGTLAVIVLAKRETLIPAVRPLLEELGAKGLRVDARVLEHALRLAGE
jgi:predicted nucleic acid-binding protein